MRRTTTSCRRAAVGHVSAPTAGRRPARRHRAARCRRPGRRGCASAPPPPSCGSRKPRCHRTEASPAAPASRRRWAWATVVGLVAQIWSSRSPPLHRGWRRSIEKAGSGASQAGTCAPTTSTTRRPTPTVTVSSAVTEASSRLLVGQGAAARHQPLDVVGPHGEQPPHRVGVRPVHEIEGDERRVRRRSLEDAGTVRPAEGRATASAPLAIVPGGTAGTAPADGPPDAAVAMAAVAARPAPAAPRAGPSGGRTAPLGPGRACS